MPTTRQTPRTPTIVQVRLGDLYLPGPLSLAILAECLPLTWVPNVPLFVRSQTAP